MSGYAAFALCGPKNVRDICLNKAKPAPSALLYLSEDGGKLLAVFLVSPSVSAVSLLWCHVVPGWFLHTANYHVCCSAVFLLWEEAHAKRSGDAKPKRVWNVCLEAYLNLTWLQLKVLEGLSWLILGLHKEEAIHLVADKPSYIVPNKNLALFWIFIV